MPLDENNRTVYEDPRIVRAYQQASSISPAELAIFEPLTERLRAAALLDIGIGAGRTTAYLGAKVSRYVGVDYSRALVEAARTRHPGADIQWCDARQMHAFADGSFDVANFSFNGIDYVDHPDRLQILGEVRRVLRPGGVWTFSSHNRDYARRGLLPWQGRFRPGRVMARKSLEAIRAHKNWRHLRGEQVETTDFALVNDEAHGYSMLTYYVTPHEQVRQLAASGFGDVLVYDQWGSPLEGSSPASMWLHYVSRRL
ncbi:Methyltransferase domain-containing protein [Nocardioides alpinus]|uniref:Class I SAM-dependent methyltransferase n=1 Tax=Nocardioides alpinus TaxID=748909 RepID=A0A1I0W361_9ACTN|nr:class I SAM-dependent methyltransferase [Nocardioides alpinus]PKH37654.1 class I SAM-dependent methyltransferase [Nocardioides alpinus]SFA83051.1 Methyltransferase domain-containing protein [Nocardioides alpinus]